MLCSFTDQKIFQVAFSSLSFRGESAVWNSPVVNLKNRNRGYENKKSSDT